MDFSAQYLQRPIPAEGNLIKREWLKYYQVPPDRQPCGFPKMPIGCPIWFQSLWHFRACGMTIKSIRFHKP
jgi:hypothetical protein